MKAYLNSVIVIAVAVTAFILGFTLKKIDTATPDISQKNEVFTNVIDHKNAGIATSSMRISIEKQILELIENDNDAQAEIIWKEYANTSPVDALILLAKLPESFAQMIMNKHARSLISASSDYSSQLLEWMDELEIRGSVDSNLRRRIFMQIASTNPAEALEHIGIFKGDEKIILLKLTLNSLVTSEPDKALDLAMKNGLQYSHDFLSGVLATLAKSDPARAFNCALENNTEDNSSLLPTIMLSWLEKDGKTALEKLNSASSVLLQNILTSNAHIEKIFEADPEALRKLLAKVPISEANRKTYGGVYHYLSNKSPQLAVAMLADLPDSSFKKEVANLMFNTIALEHPESVMQLIQSIPKELIPNAVNGAARSLAVTDLAQALQLADKLTISESNAVYADVGDVLSSCQPENAIALISDPSYAKKFDDQARFNIVKKSAETSTKGSIEEGIRFALSMSSGNQPASIAGLMNQWMKSDPISASAWLSTQPIGAARDAGAQEIINQIKDTDPEMAEQWRKSMTLK